MIFTGIAEAEKKGQMWKLLLDRFFHHHLCTNRRNIHERTLWFGRMECYLGGMEGSADLEPSSMVQKFCHIFQSLRCIDWVWLLYDQNYTWLLLPREVDLPRIRCVIFIHHWLRRLSRNRPWVGSCKLFGMEKTIFRWNAPEKSHTQTFQGLLLPNAGFLHGYTSDAPMIYR